MFFKDGAEIIGIAEIQQSSQFPNRDVAFSKQNTGIIQFPLTDTGRRGFFKHLFPAAEKVASGKPIVFQQNIPVHFFQKMQADDETLIDLGWAPSLMQTCKFTAELQNSNSAKLRCYALRLDGERTREIPLKKSGNTVEISIDTVTLGKELTPFFELVAE